MTPGADGEHADENRQRTMTPITTERTLNAYTDEEHGYRLAHPADWSVAVNGGDTTFAAPDGDVSAVVEWDGRTTAASTTALLTELDVDGYVTGFELFMDGTVRVADGRTGCVLECTYVADGERWRLCYLFVSANDTDYSLGIDWRDAIAFAGTAGAMVESFAVTA
ncbi:hypothetical protein GCM10008985_12120 [Halococcus dombrowskii]|uniref:Uncharacterized protein n=2 Tax=Halococcus dombrowskii TaxID=179637 RepID=A0AAV3SEM0_HALDO